MLRVTTPVTSSASACLGDATSRAPYCSASYTGPNAPPISISQPLQEPASTCRICSEPRTPAGGSTTGGGGGPPRSTTRPTCRIFLTHPMALLRSSGTQVFEDRDPVTEHRGQHLARDREQFGDVRRRNRVDHRVAVLAGLHHAGPPQHAQLLGQVRRLDADLRQ